jgi:cbb3-type cytochrome oxidase cytochrome c subunit
MSKLICMVVLLLWVTPVALADTVIDRYGCRGCHKIGGTGGTIAPDLQGIFDRRSEAWIRIKIQYPRNHNPQTLMPTFGFTDEQVAIIMEVLR